MAPKKMTAKAASKALNQELAKNQPEPEPLPEDVMATDSFQSLESSNIHGAQFYDIDQVEGRTAAYIIIHFKGDTTGPVKSSYTYTDPLVVEVPPIDKTLWDSFKASESKGKFFAANIRNKYKSQLIWPLGK